MTDIPEKGKRGAKPKLFPKPETITEMASIGLNKAQIADCLGMSFRTFKNKLDADPDYAMAYRIGKGKGIARVANSLFENAVMSNNFSAQAFYLRCRAKWSDQVEIKHTHEHNLRENAENLRDEVLDAQKR